MFEQFRSQMLLWTLGFAVGMAIVVSFVLLTSYYEIPLEKRVKALEDQVSSLNMDVRNLQKSNVKLWRKLEPYIKHLFSPEELQQIFSCSSKRFN